MPEALDLLARLRTPDEPPPFSDQTLVDVRAGRAVVLVAPGSVGAAVVRGGELELTVGPEARGAGVGSVLVAQALALGDPAGSAAPTLAWAHGDHPAARALAERYGWTATRTLLQLRAPIPEVAPAPSLSPPARPPRRWRVGAEPAAWAQTGWRLDPFVSGTDGADATDSEAAWLELNAAAFAHHPEQGGMTLDDLRARESDAWFDPADVLLLRDADGTLVGSCWLKVEDGVGEFYAVAVRPGRQGQGIGGVLMRAGYARLAGRGLATAALYVEGDNVPALALYRRSGFEQHAIDVQYSAPGTH